MGSSNLSAQGLGTTEPPRYELNVAMKDYDDVHYCEEEFQSLWKDAIPVTMDDVNHIVGKTHLTPEEHQPTPYEPDTPEYARAMSKLDGSWTGADLAVDYSAFH